MTKSLKHVGVLGMKWGYRKAQTENNNRFQRDLKKLHDSGKGNDTTAVIAIAKKHDERVRKTKEARDTIIKNANSILNNPKSSKDDINKALRSIGIDENGKLIKPPKEESTKKANSIVSAVKDMGVGKFAGLVALETAKTALGLVGVFGTIVVGNLIADHIKKANEW